MKKLLLALVLVPLLGIAQEKKVYKEYCFVNVDRFYAEITTSEGSIHATDSFGNRIKFKNLVGIANYMSKNGWELHSTTQNEDGGIDMFIFYRIKEEEGD